MATGRKRVARLVRAVALASVRRCRGVATTRRDPAHTPASDLVGRNFLAEAPNHVWGADINFVLTLAGSSIAQSRSTAGLDTAAAGRDRSIGDACSRPVLTAELSLLASQETDDSFGVNAI